MVTARRLLGAASLVGVVGCSLIVGEPHGRLADTPDAGESPDVGTPVTTDASDEAPAVEASPSCDPDCPASTSAISCAKGGCNEAGGACSMPGERCSCDDDRQCPSGKCVVVAGQNDQSCGPKCTGTGPADGFGCQPTACAATGFGYAPSNFDPTGYTPPAGDTTDCNGTYDSTMHAFTIGSCGGQAPVIQGNVLQVHGGQSVDVLVFKNLTLSGTLTLTGANPVIFAVYGNAKISGTINASASGATPGPGGNKCAAADNGAAGSSAQWEPGAGGGGLAGKGGNGGNSNAQSGGNGGAARGTATVPLAAGCAGSPPSNPSLGYSTPAGAGGGGVQISAAGTLDLTGGTVTATGSNGGPGEPGKCANLYPAQNGTGGAGGGSGGVVLLEGSTVTSGTSKVSGGTGGTGGAAPSPNGQAGGNGGSAGQAGKPGVQMGTAPSGCSWGGYWSGGGGGGGSNGVTQTNAAGACLCTADSACSSGACSDVAKLCTGACSGATATGSYDSSNCQIPVSASAFTCAAGKCSDVTSADGACTAAGVPCWCTSDAQCATGTACVAWAGCQVGACTGAGTGDGFHCAP